LRHRVHASHHNDRNLVGYSARERRGNRVRH